MSSPRAKKGICVHLDTSEVGLRVFFPPQKPNFSSFKMYLCNLVYRRQVCRMQALAERSLQEGRRVRVLARVRHEQNARVLFLL